MGAGIETISLFGSCKRPMMFAQAGHPQRASHPRFKPGAAAYESMPEGLVKAAKARMRAL